MADATNPTYYGDGTPPPVHRDQPVQLIEIIETMGLNWEEGNILKYVARHRFKNGRQDLEKAQWMLTRLIQRWDYEHPQTDGAKA